VNIVVDQNIRGAQATFGRHAPLRFMDGRAIRREHLEDVTALIVRTATRIDRNLLEGTPVAFVGSTSIGTDHMDIPWLDQQGIAWANAPGCNADSAAQYTLAMIWLALERLGRSLDQASAAVIGRGNVGSRVQSLLQTLAVPTEANDPPLAEAGHADLVPLDAALNHDIVCLHVPLTRTGPHPTLRLIGARQLARMPDGALLVNTARGDVIDGEALLAELRSGRLHAALDVWPGEPLIDGDLLRAAVVATPHVAGYSEDGKRRGTRMVYTAFCQWAGLQAEPAQAVPGDVPVVAIRPGEDPLDKALDASCFVRRHDSELRALANHTVEERAAGFDRLRRDYPSRRDFQAWTIDTIDASSAPLLHKLGFQVRLPDMPSQR